MKVRKFIIGAVMTVVTCMSTLSASAVSYVADYDANNDGSVNIRDVAYINRILKATSATLRVEDLDANQNGIVDDIDMLTILYYVQGKEFMFVME